MKICFICPEYPEGPHGGIGTFVRIISRELVKMGNEVRVIGVYPEDYPAPDYEEDEGVKVWRIRTKKGKIAWFLPWYRQYKIIKQWVSEKQVDIIEAPDSRGWYAFWGRLNVPIILRSHGCNTYFSYLAHNKPNTLTKFFEKRSFRRADYYASVSKYTADVTKSIFNIKDKFTVIYNGIILPPYLMQEREPDKIIYAGTLIEKKGVVQLIEAAIILYRNGIKFTLEMYGKDTTDKSRGSMREYLLKMIPDDLKGSIAINTHITRNELLKKYATATVAVFPSYSEAFALAPIESMACGCPTIYSLKTSGAELIDNGADGLLIDPDKPQEIADAVTRIFTDHVFAKDISEKGREKSKLFSAEIMADRTYDFYVGCLADFKAKYNKKARN